MDRQIKLSILDQSIVTKGNTARDAINNTIETVKLAERLGYHRFWVSEHHNATTIAGSAPEVLMVKLADVTETIRIGSGGIMLPNHSALKVAENFRLLETMFPGRIDLGMGRAPGGDRITASLLNPSNRFSESEYLEQLEQLQAFFTDKAASQFGPVLAVPQATTIPAQWILSSSGGSASIAAKFGLGLAVAKFINGFAQPQMAADYRNNFEPSETFPEPQVLIALMVLCADTEDKAVELRKLMDYRFLQFEKGKFNEMVDYEDIRDYQFSVSELSIIQHNSNRIISGTKEQVKSQLLNIANDFEVDEIIVSTMTHEQSDRLRSFELLAEAFLLADSIN
jgi:luciferase family oxidoreductase group 1